MRQGKARDAIDHYREAERLNPDDFLGFFSEADAIARLGNLGEARELLTRALVLQPRRETVLKVLHFVEARIGAVIDDEPLRPKAAFVRGNDLVTSAGTGDPAAIWWGVYAMCKRIGAPEQIAREGKALPAQRRWNSQNEEICLRKTASAYAERRGEKGADPALERFLTADAAGLASAFVLYEVASRLDPQIVLEVPLEQRKLVDPLLGKDATDSEIAELRAVLRTVPREVLARRFHEMALVDVSGEFRALEVPVLYLAGVRDRLVGPAAVAELRALRPEMDVCFLDAPHLVLQRKPADAAAAISRFLLTKTGVAGPRS